MVLLWLSSSVNFFFMPFSSETVGALEKPSYASVYIHVLTFLCGTALPKICTTMERSLAVLALILAAITTIAIQMRNAGFESQALYHASVFFLILLFTATVAFLVLLHRMTQMHLANRKAANPTALEIVELRIKSDRLLREDKYDIYLPPTLTEEEEKSSSSSASSYPVAFFMLPGALLEHNVYAAICAKLSDCGILVVLQNCEPFRVAAENQFSSEDDIKGIIRQIEERHGIRANKWSIGGHSMGGYTAMMIAKKSNFFDSLVTYGVNKNYDLEKTNVRALSITASRDGLKHSTMADMSTFDCWNEAAVNGRLVHKIIEGGNHSGFGDYPRQTFPLPDLERTIPLEEQHRQIVLHTSTFLMPKQE